MAVLVMYQNCNATQYCLGKDWNRVKGKLHGSVEYALFPLVNTEPDTISEKISECQGGNAKAIGGGHLCLK